MPNNQINEMFSYISKENEAPSQRVKYLFTSIYKEIKPASLSSQPLTKVDFQNAFTRLVSSGTLDEQLLCLFYHLDRDKKGYISPEDIVTMFDIFGQKISLGQIQNSFKYAKVYKNKMSFEDFKEYYHKF